MNDFVVTNLTPHEIDVGRVLVPPNSAVRIDGRGVSHDVLRELASLRLSGRATVIEVVDLTRTGGR